MARNSKLLKKRSKKMAIFGKMSFQKLVDAFNGLSEEEKEKFKSEIAGEPSEPVEEPAVEEKTEEEVVEEKDNEEVSEPAEEVAEENVEETPTEEVSEEPAETEATEEEVETATEDVNEAMNARIETLVEELNAYKEKVDKLYERLEDVDKPAETVGLGKQRSVEEADDDNEMSAHDYAMKHAKY